MYLLILLLDRARFIIVFRVFDKPIIVVCKFPISFVIDILKDY